MFSEELKRKLAEQLDSETISQLTKEIASEMRSQEQKYTSIVLKLQERCKEIADSSKTLKQVQNEREQLKQEMLSRQRQIQSIEDSTKKMQSQEESMRDYKAFLDRCELETSHRENAADEREQKLDERETNIDAEVKKRAQEMSLSARMHYKAVYDRKAEENEEQADKWVETYGMILKIFMAYSLAVTLLWAVNSENFRTDVVDFISSIGMFCKGLFGTTWRWAAAIPGPKWIQIVLGIILRFVIPIGALAGIAFCVYLAAQEYARNCADDLSVAVTAVFIAGISFGVDGLHHIFPWINVIWTFWAAEGIYLLVRRRIQIHRNLYEV